MKAHVVEVGPSAVRRLCCGTATVADADMERAALESLDDPLALFDGRPVCIESLWRALLEPVGCGANDVVVAHPSWWAPSRVRVISAAADVLGDQVVVKPRSWLLRQASRCDNAVVVEIADRFVVATAAATEAESRSREQRRIVEAVTRSVRGLAAGSTETVVIDAPRTVRGADELSAAIAAELRTVDGMTVLTIGDSRLRSLAAQRTTAEGPVSLRATAEVGRRRWKLAPAAPIAATALIGALMHPPAPPPRHEQSTTHLVEGHVALEVPAQWPVRRIVTGPGSARLQISSPSDPEAALLVTQSRVALPSLAATAEFLRSSIDAAPAGVFVDFNPADRSAGRPVVTYREIRAGHDVRWTVWVDKAVRISIGCQSRCGDDDDGAVVKQCDVAVRSARAVI